MPISYEELLDLLRAARELHELTHDPMLTAAIPILASLLPQAPVVPDRMQTNAVTYVRRTIHQQRMLFGNSL